MSPEAFELRIGALGAPELTVLSLRGEEAISQLFLFDVIVRTENDLLAYQADMLGEPATLTMSIADEAPRVVHGIVSTLEDQGWLPHDGRRFRVRVTPRMELLRWRQNSRIFQDLSLVDIVDRVLDEHRVPRRWSLRQTHPERAYCVQYRETDLDFVTRLCAEAGIFFFFQPIPAPTDEKTDPERPAAEVVFCDDAGDYPPIVGGGLERDQAIRPAPQVPMHAAASGLTGGEAIHEITYRSSIRAESVALRDYDFERPLLDLAASFKVGQTARRLEIYEHHGEYAESDVSRNHADTQLEQYRARAKIARGTSTCRRLVPGHRFSLENGPRPEMGEYAVIRVTHEAIDPAEASRREAASPLNRYSNRFECVSADVQYRPKRPRRDLSQVLESAVVVGPTGQEIYTDQYGRIKVQFHWDREGERNELSSCWMRVMQPWGGASWGCQFIPRVGMEVLVSFLGGDEDRPVVLGSVYNATHPPAFPLPLGRTQSGIRTQSIDGAGSNELSFDDAAGGEVVLLKAQRDLVEQALRDHSLRIGGDQAAQIAGSQRVEVEGGRHDRVAGVETRSVGMDQLSTIAGEQRLEIAGRKTETIQGSMRLDVHGVTTHNHGNHAEIIEGYASISVGSGELPAGLSVTVHGSESHDVSKSLTLRSDTRLLLECGGSSITLTPEGVRIDAKTIVVKAQEKLILLGDGPGIELSTEADILADTIKLFSKGGSVELDSEAAHMDGPLVKLNCGAGDEPEIEDDVPKPATKTFQWTFLDANLEPYRDKTYRLLTQGFKCRGTTDSDGVIQKDIPEDAFSAEITLWTGDFPEGERVTSIIRLDDLPPALSVYGAQIRLRNLGYYLGDESDEMSPELAGALAAFQVDHGLPSSGKLDAETADKLDEIHPG